MKQGIDPLSRYLWITSLVVLISGVAWHSILACIVAWILLYWGAVRQDRRNRK